MRPCQTTWLALVASAGVALLSTVPDTFGSPASIATIVNFAGANGANPRAGLCLGSDGNFYGTTDRGGDHGLPTGGWGTLFRLTPGGSLTALASFGAPNGTRPYAGLVQSPLDGNFYGTTLQGGSANSGTLFRLTSAGTLTTLLSFTSANGAQPSARLINGHDGYLYGTTQYGGSSNLGTVFKVSTAGTLTTLVSFNGTNGANPNAEVFQMPDGLLYGTTVNGGVSNLGTVFRLTTNGALTTIVSFTNANGANPYGGVVADVNHVLYGTTAYGGANGFGSIFRLTTNGVMTTLHSFLGGADGDNPRASLLYGRDAKLYGTTTLGGDISGGIGWGTVFQVTTNGQLTLLAAFNYDTNGISPYCSLIQDASGNLYGTTFSQGTGLKGTVFRLDPAGPRLETASSGPGTFSFKWEAWPGLTYQVQYKTDLAQPGWSDLNNPLLATNGNMTTTDSTASGPSRYYQLKRLTSP